jgi:tRNA-splicing ligase RtcB
MGRTFRKESVGTSQGSYFRQSRRNRYYSRFTGNKILQGIIHSIRGKSDLEEASSAYKDIAQVMDFQADLVKIKVALSLMAVVKG